MAGTNFKEDLAELKKLVYGAYVFISVIDEPAHVHQQKFQVLYSLAQSIKQKGLTRCAGMLVANKNFELRGLDWQKDRWICHAPKDSVLASIPELSGRPVTHDVNLTWIDHAFYHEDTFFQADTALLTMMAFEFKEFGGGHVADVGEEKFKSLTSQIFFVSFSLGLPKSLEKSLPAKEKADTVNKTSQVSPDPTPSAIKKDYKKDLAELQKIIFYYKDRLPSSDAVLKVHDQGLEYCLATYLANKCFEIKKLRWDKDTWMVSHPQVAPILAKFSSKNHFWLSYQETVACFHFSISQDPETILSTGAFALAAMIDHDKDVTKLEIVSLMAMICWRACHEAAANEARVIKLLGVKVTDKISLQARVKEASGNLRKVQAERVAASTVSSSSIETDKPSNGAVGGE